MILLHLRSYFRGDPRWEPNSEFVDALTREPPATKLDPGFAKLRDEVANSLASWSYFDETLKPRLGALARTRGLPDGLPARSERGWWRRGPSAQTLAALATVAAWTLFLGIATDRAELFVAVIPIAVGLCSPVRKSRMPRFELRQQVSADRASEEDRVCVQVRIDTPEPAAIVEILAALPTLVEPVSGNVAADRQAQLQHEG
ncbi:MAG TPA: hypothetical protein VGF34_06840 [Stellaceae bacterium]